MTIPRTSRRLLIAVLLAGAACRAGAQEPAVTEPASAETAASETQLPVVGNVEVIPLRTEAADAGVSEERVPTQLEEIVVTATKRAAPVRNIPATVNVLSGEDLERQGVQSIEQIVSLVPGVNLTDEGTGGAAKRITIRGISTALNVNPTAGTLFGDIPFSDPFSPKVQLDPNPFDMATVEVLKGPQGTLFGGTGLNGLIRYVPEAAQLDTFQLKYFTQYNAYPQQGGDGWSYGAAVNMPFADHTAAVRLMGFHRDAPGYIDDTRNDRQDINTLAQTGFRGSFTWLPADRWKISLMGATQQTEEDDLNYTDNYDGNLEHGDSPRPSPSESSYTLGSLTIEREFDSVDVIAQSSYFKKQFEIFLDASRAVGGALPLLAGIDDNHSEGMTHELRLVSAPGDSPWKWLAGAFYYDLDLYDCASIGAGANLPLSPVLSILGSLLPPSLDPILDSLLAPPCPGKPDALADTLGVGTLTADINLKEQALFGELTRELGESWEVTLGARGYRIETSGRVTSAGVLYSASNRGQVVDRNAQASEDGISPKASIVFHPTDELRAYFTVSRGFRFGGPQLSASTPTTDVPASYKSDSLWSYELGLRSDWFDRSLRLDASAYRIDWENPQIYQISSDGLTGYIDNVGGAKGEGVELSMRYLPPFAPGLSLNTAVAWNRTVTTVVFESQQEGTVAVGSPWPLAPRWQTSTTLEYSLPLETWQSGISLRHTYLGEACNTIDCTAQVFGYRTLDLNLFATPIGDSYWPGISVSLNNLTDERGNSNISVNPFPAGDTVTYIAPRAVVLRLSGSF